MVNIEVYPILDKLDKYGDFWEVKELDFLSESMWIHTLSHLQESCD